MKDYLEVWLPNSGLHIIRGAENIRLWNEAVRREFDSKPVEVLYEEYIGRTEEE